MVVWGVSDYSECSECSIYQGSHRFNEIQQDDYLGEFVVVCGWKKFLQQNIRVIRGICGFKAKPQISHKFSRIIRGQNGLFLNNFAYLCLYTFKKAFVS